MSRFVRAVILIGGLGSAGAGVWAFVAPVSFYNQLATFPPYNQHFIHDIGAFQIGIGVALLAALRWADAPFVALMGAAIGSVFHFAAHVQDADLGGRDSDPWLIGLLTAVVAAGAVARALVLQREGQRKGE